jgi:hypothetical protein
MGCLDAFVTEMNRTFTTYLWGATLDSNDNPGEGYSTTKTVIDKKSAFYEASAAQSLVSARYKDKISGVVICEPNVTVADNSKLILDTGDEFKVLHADNVMFQGEVLVIMVTTDDYGVSVNG